MCKYAENKAESHGNNHATNPSLIKLLNIEQYDNKAIKSGSYLPMKFSIFDSYENLIQDPYKYYSDIVIKVLMDNTYNKTEKYIIKGNVGSFNNGMLCLLLYVNMCVFIILNYISY